MFLWLGAYAMMTTAPQRTETERWRRVRLAILTSRPNRGAAAR